MKVFSLILFLFSLMSATVPLSASVVSDIENAISVYSTNTARGIEVLLQVYNGKHADLQVFKGVLYERQSYQLYSELLARLPLGKETANETLQMDLILGRTSGFLSDLSNYLKFENASSAAEKYADLIVKNPSCLDFLAAGYQPGLFLVLKNSYIRMKQFAQFDAFLSKTGTNSGIPAAEVKTYLKESWPFKQRNLANILEAFALGKDPDMTVYSAASAFASGDYPGTLEYFSTLQPELRKKEAQYKALQVDLPYLFFYSLFRQSRYRDALQDIGRFYFPDQNDLSELRFLCYLGLDDLKNAAREINSMRENSKRYFYAGMLLILENPSNGMDYFERYLQELDESQIHLPETMLVYYASVKTPQKIPALSDMIKRSLLFRETSPVKDLALTYAFVLSPGDARNNRTADWPGGMNSAVSGYIKYALSLSKKSSGDEPGAKKILNELIRSTNTSPLVRSMAIYQMRNTD